MFLRRAVSCSALPSDPSSPDCAPSRQHDDCLYCGHKITFVAPSNYGYERFLHPGKCFKSFSNTIYNMEHIPEVIRTLRMPPASISAVVWQAFTLFKQNGNPFFPIRNIVTMNQEVVRSLVAMAFSEALNHNLVRTIEDNMRQIQQAGFSLIASAITHQRCSLAMQETFARNSVRNSATSFEGMRSPSVLAQRPSTSSRFSFESTRSSC